MKTTKYVLIDRGELYKRTAVSLRVAQDIESRGEGVIGQPVTLSVIKKERIHIYREEDYFQHKAHEDFVNKYNGKTFSGTVLWVDSLSGNAEVRLDDGTKLYANFTAFEGVAKNNFHWPRIEDQEVFKSFTGKEVKVVPYITHGYYGCEKVSLIVLEESK